MTPSQLSEARRVKPGHCCLDCHLPYSEADFYWNGRKPYSYCKPCWTLRSSSKNRDRSAYRRSPRGLAQDLVATLRTRARKRGIPFAITIPWVAERLSIGRCEMTGLPLDMRSGPRRPFGPSLDRKQPTLGYTPDNVQLVCWIYNAAKGTGTHADVLKLSETLHHVPI